MMIDCNEARELLALEPASEDAALQGHLEGCVSCTRYRRPHQALDMALRAELQWKAPPALTAQLLAIAVAGPMALVAPQFMARQRPKRWYVTVVYLLTAAAIGLSLAIAWQFLVLLAAQIGLGDALTQLLAAPSQGLAQLMRALPLSRTRSTSSSRCANSCYGCCSPRCCGRWSISGTRSSASGAGKSLPSQSRG